MAYVVCVNISLSRAAAGLHGDKSPATLSGFYDEFEFVAWVMAYEATGGKPPRDTSGPERRTATGPAMTRFRFGLQLSLRVDIPTSAPEDI